MGLMHLLSISDDTVISAFGSPFVNTKKGHFVIYATHMLLKYK